MLSVKFHLWYRVIFVYVRVNVCVYKYMGDFKVFL